MRRILIVVTFAALMAGVAASILAQETKPGLSADDLSCVLEQIPAEAPLVYLQHKTNLLPNQRAVILATDLYFVAERESRAAKVYFFVETPGGWHLAYETDTDERLADQKGPPDWETSLASIECADVDEDSLTEVVVFWDSEPWQVFSLVQYSTIVHVLDYDIDTSEFYEVTGDRIVCNPYNEDAFLFNVDCDPEEEIVVYEEIWEPGTCIVCAKRYRVTVWTMRDGQLVLDPDWNNGQPWETSECLCLEGCDFLTLLQSVIEGSPCAP